MSRRSARFAGVAAIVLVGLLALAPAFASAPKVTVTYVYTNPQGTPLARADANGTLLARYDYTPYGQAVGGPPPAGPGYTGHVNDPETGLVYMQARYYDPEIRRFLSVDPITKNFNKYAYARNNPLNFVDPTGMEAECSVDCMKMRRVSDSYSLGVSYFSSLVSPGLSFGSGTSEVNRSWSENGRQVVQDLAFKGIYFSGNSYNVQLGKTGITNSPMAFDGKEIIVSPSALNGDWNSRQLAGFLGHELYHISDFENKRFTLSKDVWTYYKRALSEVNAYKWGRQFAGHYDLDDPFYIDQFNKQIEQYSPCAFQKICDISIF